MLKTPQDRLRLSRGVGDGLPNRPRDVAAVAAALDHLGRHTAGDEGPLTSRSQLDRRLDNALRAVQRGFGLTPDGRVRPGGPTAAVLNTLMAGGLGALVPDTAVHRSRGDFLQRLKLNGSVGEGGDNRPEDRQLARLGLGLSGDLEPGGALDEAIDDRRLGDGVERLHRRHGLSGGRRLVPGSRGEAILANVLKRTYGDRLPEESKDGDGSPVIRAAGPDSDGAGSRRMQVAQVVDEENADIAPADNASETGRYVVTDDPALGIWEGGKSFGSWADYIQRAERATGVEIPEYKKREHSGREKELFLNWYPWHLALKDAEVGEVQHFAFMLIFAWEGSLTPHLNKDREILAVAGIPNERIDKYADDTNIPLGTRSQHLSNKQRVAWYRAQYNFDTGAFHSLGGAEALEQIGDNHIAAAVADTFFTRGTPSIGPVLQDSINATFAAYPDVALAFAISRDGGQGSSQARIESDSRFGPESLLALQTIAQSVEAKQFLLNAIADERIALDQGSSSGLLPGDEARYNYFRFQ